MGERKRATEKEREREREGERVRGKTDVPKLYAYDECEHSMIS